jgi:hypothetical protein
MLYRIMIMLNLTYPFDHISFMSMTNVFSSIFSCLVIGLKGKWSLRRRQGFHSTLSVPFILRHHSSLALHIGIIFHSYIICQRGRQLTKGLIFHSKYPFLAIHTKGGESISPKQKDRTTTNFQFSKFKRSWNDEFSIGIVFQFGFKEVFSNWYLTCDIISNWYTLFKINIKTLLNTKRRISLRGSVV